MTQYRIDSSQPTGIVVHGLHKSATMFLYQLFQRLSRARGIACYSSNHSQPNDELVTPDIDHDFCLCPIRTFENAPFEFTGKQKIHRIFHVRDPRDILVSQYYSFGWRHSDQEFNPGRQRQRESIQQMSVDQYVLHPDHSIKPIQLRFSHLLKRDVSDLKCVVKYEQMVTDFPGWLSKVLPVFQFRFPALTKARFAYRYRNEFQPDSDPKSHKRSVVPGDYLRRLQPETISRLNEILSEELSFLKYDINAVPPHRMAA